MVKLNIYNQKGDVVGEKNVSEKVFGVKVNESLVYQAVVTQGANERQTLAHTKLRSEVSGGGKKPWKQKGTGRARAGSSRSPIWIGGGITFGPRSDRNFKKSINKKMKQKAILMALSDKVANDALVVLDDMNLAEFKTKTVDSMIANLEKKLFNANSGQKKEKKEDVKKSKAIKRSILIISESDNDKLKYSSRNLVGVNAINFQNINIIDLLKNRQLVTSQAIIEKIEEVYGK